MPVLNIVTYNDPILRTKSEAISENNTELQRLIDDMFETMYNADGVGLAAPQIGKPVRLFVMDADTMAEEDEEKFGPLAMINPEITEASTDKIPLEEGCLSIPEIRDKIIRPSVVTVDFLDRDFQKRRIKAEGWAARVIQHELDHLEGILFIDYLSAFRRRLHKAALSEIDAGTIEVKYPVFPKML